MTLAEIQASISNLVRQSDLPKKMALEKWFIADLIPRFEGRVLGVDEIVARKWGQIVGEAKSRGICIPSNDALIAATATTHNLIVLTENGKDFQHSGVSLYNPYL